MASLDKLIKTIDQIKILENANAESHTKKKDLRLHLHTLVELLSNPNLQNHKDFVTHVAPGIDSIIRLCDSKESDIRLASDEGINKVFKALIPLHSNRILVELCKQIKKNESPRILKLSMNRFAELCHLSRPQKRRAYLANLLNAISVICGRKEEMLHESLSNFVTKVFNVMGIFAFENETKSLLKGFLSNLAASSPIIRRCAANCITTIISTNRKLDILLVLVVEYLTDQILLSEETPITDTSVITGTLLTLKLLLPLFQSALVESSDNLSPIMNPIQPKKTSTVLNPVVTSERIVQIFELGVHYSLSSDHNVVTSALELLQQMFKMRSLMLAIPVLKNSKGLQGTRISSLGLLKANSQWNLAPLPIAEESLLIETDIPLDQYDKLNAESIDNEAEIAEEESVESNVVQLSSKTFQSDSDTVVQEIEPEHIFMEGSDDFASGHQQLIDIGSLYDTKELSPLIFCARHLAYNFLLSERKGILKSDRSVRISVKSLALNCLAHLGSLEPLIWNSHLSETDPEKIAITDVLQYNHHEDPQLRGQVALLGCMILSSVASGFIVNMETKSLVQIVDKTLKDKETAACRLAVHGLQNCIPIAVESPFCVEVVPLFRSLLALSENPYWLVKVDLLEFFASFSWIALEFGLKNQSEFNLPIFQEAFLRKLIFSMVGDEDHRVRSATASCLSALVQSWTTPKSTPNITRVKRMTSVNQVESNIQTFVGVPLPIYGVAEAYIDVRLEENVVDALSFFVDETLQLLVTSNSKFTKMGCIQVLVGLTSAYPPTSYLNAYGCSGKETCSLLKISSALMSNSTLMLDLATHQALLTLAAKLFAGCVKANLVESPSERRSEEWQFLNEHCGSSASFLLGHASKTLNAFCCVLEDMNPSNASLKAPLVMLPNPSTLSPIRRKLKNIDVPITEKDERPEEFGRKWNKPTQLLSPSNIGFFGSQPLYMKLYDLLKGTYATCKLNFDTATTERLSNFIQATLEMIVVLLEVSVFQDIAKHSEEILNYLRVIITYEPVFCLHSVQQLLKALFGANLAAVWHEESSRLKRSSITADSPTLQRDVNSCDLNDLYFQNPTRYERSRTSQRANLITKFRTTLNKTGPDKSSMSSYIRLFEPMVIKALKLYTVTSSPRVQKHVLDLLCELIQLCVNYCLLDADQVFLNFVIQQFEFLEEGFIPQVDILLPSMFRFLSLLSYDRFHSKSIISVPRIMQLAGGLMATGKDAEIHVLPTLHPMMEDLFLSRERMSDDQKELETQKEVLLNILIRLVQYHKVYPLMSTILLQVQLENANKWKSLSKQICDALLPHIQKHSLFLDSNEALQMLQKLISHLDTSTVHESLLGLLQTFTSTSSSDLSSLLISTTDCDRVVACRLLVFNTLIAVFDEPFLLDCLNEFNLSYLINQRSDPLNVSPTENLPSEKIFSCLLVDTLKGALSHWKGRMARDSSWSGFTSSKSDHASFAVQLVMGLIDLIHQLLSTNFPVLKLSIIQELKQEECKNSLLETAKSLIPNNPIVFVRIWALVSSEVKLLLNEADAPLHGLNSYIAKTGQFLAASNLVIKNQASVSSFVKSYADFLLDHYNQATVKGIVEKFFVSDQSHFDVLRKCALKKNNDSLVTSALCFLNTLEIVQGSISEDLLINTISDFKPIKSYAVHNKLCALILNRSYPCQETKFQFLKTVQEIIEGFSHRSCYAKLATIPSVMAYVETRTINKSFVLSLAKNRVSCPWKWKEIVSHIEEKDLPDLLNNHEFLMFLLGNRKNQPKEFFHLSKKFILDQLSVEHIAQNEILPLACLVGRLCQSISRSEIKEILNEVEIEVLSRTTLVFISEMNQLFSSFILLQASFDVVSLLSRELPVEWTRQRNLPLVLRSIDSLVNFSAQLGENSTIHSLAELGLEGMEDLESLIVRALQQMARLVMFIELKSTEIPPLLNQHLQCVVHVFCRMPLFFSCVCIPPSVWGKGWNPKFVMDKDSNRLDLPIIPTHLLHDEVVLKEFIYRIDQIGWISRQKFEEIWMTFLGVLNLHNEDQVRPEEQASVVQATCEAVRALTMVLVKNLPFMVSRTGSMNDSDSIADFMSTERGKKLQELSCLLEGNDHHVLPCKSAYQINRLSFKHIQRNIDQGSPSKKKSSSPEDVTEIDIQSCVHFLVDLYLQWLQNANTPYPLLVDLFRSLVQISNFFVDVQQFERMHDSAITLYKQLLPDDPASLESALVSCVLKSASFITMNAEGWEMVKKLCESSLISHHISIRASGLDGLMYLLQRFNRSPDPNRSSSFVNLAMDYAEKYLVAENGGPIWYQSLLWSIAFYCGEHFGTLPYHNFTVLDFVIQSSLNGLVESSHQPLELVREVLQGLERFCVLGVLVSKWRVRVKIELLNILRNVNRDSILQPALKTLMSLVYSDFGSQLYKPGEDPETMLAAMEWVGALFQRMKRGTDSEAELIGRIMPVITCDIFPPADILNRILNEFMTARPTVASSLAPTIFKVFGTARVEGQQSLVVEWILLSLTNFTHAPKDSSDISVWNILCFFTAASDNSWLKSVFPLVSRPINSNDLFEVEIFVASAIDFRSQLNDQQCTVLASIFNAAKEKCYLFACVDAALKNL